jgi:hypothetical protein
MVSTYKLFGRRLTTPLFLFAGLCMGIQARADTPSVIDVHCISNPDVCALTLDHAPYARIGILSGADVSDVSRPQGQRLEALSKQYLPEHSHTPLFFVEMGRWSASNGDADQGAMGGWDTRLYVLRDAHGAAVTELDEHVFPQLDSATHVLSMRRSDGGGSQSEATVSVLMSWLSPEGPLGQLRHISIKALRTAYLDEDLNHDAAQVDARTDGDGAWDVRVDYPETVQSFDVQSVAFFSLVSLMAQDAQY